MASTLDRQVGRVRLRMVLGSLLASVAWSWVAALALAICWFLSQPYLIPDAPEWLRWAVLGGLGGVGTLTAIGVSLLRAPTAVAAALSLDERFALKERVTTSITLAPEEAASPAGQALLQDVEQKLGQVRIGDRFPIGLPWKPAALLPVGALAILCVVFFWNPRVGASRAGEESDFASPVAKEDVDKQMKQLAVKKREKKAEEPAKAADLARIDEDIDKFTRRPRETRDDIRDRIKDATALEDEIRRQQKEQAERIEAFKEQMKQMERLRRKNRGENKDNPAKKAADALARGDMDKAQEEFQKLADEMKKEEEEKERLRRKKRDAKTDDERKKAEEELEKLERESKLSRKKEEMEKQMQDLQDQLERLTRDKDEIAQDLKDMEKNGEIDKEELDRELEKLDKNAEKLTSEEIKELAEAMKECKECTEKGDEDGAAKAMEKAAKAAGKMGKGEEGQELQRKLVQIQKVKKALCRSLGNKPGGQGSGRRPEAADKGDTATDEKYAPGQWGKGKREVVGDGPMGGFKGPRKPSEMAEEIRQAAQETPAAIDRQRLPPSARKMARGYFEKVRGPDKVAPPKKDLKKP